MVEDIVYIKIYSTYDKILNIIIKALSIGHNEYIVLDIIVMQIEKCNYQKINIGNIIIKENSYEYSIMHQGNKIYLGCENLHISDDSKNIYTANNLSIIEYK